jgi:hypothetical protein
MSLVYQFVKREKQERKSVNKDNFSCQKKERRGVTLKS